MFLLLSLASSTALLAPGPGRRGVPRLLESSTTARSPPLMNQAPTGPAGEAANTGSAVKRWLASRCLPFAVLSGNVGFGKMLIKAGANLETLIVEGEFTSLQCAVVLGHVGLVEALAEGGASLEATGKSVGATTPLQLAIGKENVEVIKALIEAGASLEAADGFAPLQFAISQGYDVEVKRALIEGGASLDAAAGGFTPLQLAISLGNIDTLRADLETKASLEAACGFESTPLQQVVSNGNWPSVMAMPDGNKDAIKMLVEAGAPLEAAGELDLTALELAMHLGNVDVIKALIQAGGSLETVEGGSELTAMEFAIDNGLDVEVNEVLIEAGDFRRGEKLLRVAISKSPYDLRVFHRYVAMLDKSVIGRGHGTAPAASLLADVQQLWATHLSTPPLAASPTVTPSVAPLPSRNELTERRETRSQRVRMCVNIE